MTDPPNLPPRVQPERFESKRDDVARKIKSLECDRRSKVIDRHSKRSVPDRPAPTRPDSDWPDSDRPDSEQPAFDFADRTAALQAIKARREQGLSDAFQTLKESNRNGLSAAGVLSDATDRILREIYTGCCLNREVPLNRMALVAVGGYGRAQLAPGSDIDLLFLVPDQGDPDGEAAIETFLYYLWDAGFKVGQATRTVNECVILAKDDITIATTLLEARLLCGDADLFNRLGGRYRSRILAKLKSVFLAGKLLERDQRHAQPGASRYALEPNIKEGIGGLRDLQTLYWILKFLRGELPADVSRNGTHEKQLQADLQKDRIFTKAQTRTFVKAEQFFWALRFHLHTLTGRAEERLTFDYQPGVAYLMGYSSRNGQSAVERFMQHYFFTAKSVGNLTRIVLSSVEKEYKSTSRFRLPRYLQRHKTVGGFVLKDRRVGVVNRKWFHQHPKDLLRIFAVAQKHRLDIDPLALRYVTQSLHMINRDFMQNEDTNKLFIHMLTSRKNPGKTLRRLNDAGVLSGFIPDFGRIVGMMQFDGYHHFTVDEHTLFAVDALWQLEQGTIARETPLSTEFMGKIRSRRALYVATFLHDIAKGRNGPHEILGAEVAARLCPRFCLDEQETDLVVWLVRNHLVLSSIVLKRDIDDPQTVKDYVQTVESLEHARCLHILTSADIRAVGPGTWNSWKATMMRHMYFRTADYLRGELDTYGRQARIQSVQDRVAAVLKERQNQVRPPETGQEAGQEAGEEKGVEQEGTQTSGKSAFTKIAEQMPESYWLAHTPYDLARQIPILAEADRRQEPLTIDIELPSDAAFSGREDGLIDPQRLLDDVRLLVYLDDHHGIMARVAGAIALSGGSIEDARIHTARTGRALQVYTVKAVSDDEETLVSMANRLRQQIPLVLRGEVKVPEMLKERARAGSPRVSVFERPTQVFIDNDAAERHTVVEVLGHDMPGTLYWITRALSDLSLQIHNAKVASLGTRFVDVFYVQDLVGHKIRSGERMARIRSRILSNLRNLNV